MKKIAIFILFKFIITQQLFSQITPNISFQGKWTDNRFGIEINGNCIKALLKKQNWKPSDKDKDIFYFIGTPYISNENTFKCWVANTFVRGTIHFDQPETKEAIKEYKVIELKLKKDGKLILNYSPSYYGLYDQQIRDNVPELMKEAYDHYGYIENDFKFRKLVQE